MGEIIFNGISSRSLGIEVEHRPSFVSPERDYTLVEVKGRQGTLIRDNGGFKNYDREYEIAIYKHGQPLVETVDNVMGWLRSAYGYTRLEDSYDPSHYFMAVYKEETNVQNILGEAGKAKIKFNCAPQRWLKSGEDFVRITVDDLENVTNGMETLVNPTFNISNPLIKVKAIQGGESGFITVANSKDVYTVYIGYKAFLDRGITEYTIDCQNHDTYCRYNQNEGNELQPAVLLEAIDSMNSVSYGVYPTFSPGNNSIVFSGFDYIEIQPRWWIV